MIEPWRIRCPFCGHAVTISVVLLMQAPLAAGVAALGELERHAHDEHGRSTRELHEALRC